LSVGLVTASHPPQQQVGTSPGSMGWSVAERTTLRTPAATTSARGRPVTADYAATGAAGKGDVVGCAWVPARREMFFTRDGRALREWRGVGCPACGGTRQGA
jgi:hypothetical protein